MPSNRYSKIRLAIGLMLTVLFLVAAVPEAQAAQVWANCVPTEVTVWSGHAHVRCSVATGGILFFAVRILPNSANAPEVDRFVRLTSEGRVHARPLAMLFETTDTTANAWGCGANNCRRPIAYSLR